MKTYTLIKEVLPDWSRHFTEETTGWNCSGASDEEAIQLFKDSLTDAPDSFRIEVTTFNQKTSALRGAMLQIDSLSYQLERLKHERDEAVKRAEAAEARAASAVKRAEYPNQRAKKIVETIQIYLGKVLGDNPMYGMNDPIRLAAEFQKELTKEYKLLWPEG